MRSLLFNISFYVFTGLTAILSIPYLLAPTRRPLVRVIRTWSRGVLWLMRTVAGIRVEVRGREHIPTDGPALIAAKHQSECDGIVILSLVPDLACVAMKDLMKYPVVGRILKKLEMILVDTCGGETQRQLLAERSKAARDTGRPILIYPEGQLVPVGDPTAYKQGIFNLYAALDLPVVPVATNVGLRWHCRDWTKKPGPAVVEFLPPIATGLDQSTFMSLLEDLIETRSNTLVGQAAASQS
jgi:1-acyl-sn-glycerol-3-phosphate acyltransferase